MLCAVGDLLDDVIVWLGAPIGRATDTPARIFHRRGGSAANVAAFAARSGRPARFIGRVGDDLGGERVAAMLAAEGVDVRVQRAGRTGTVVVLVEPGGERTMLSDRGSATDLSEVPDGWVEGAGVVHLTTYSLTAEPMAGTAGRLAGLARERGALVSIDASSVRALLAAGVEHFLATLTRLQPDVLLANEDEARLIGADRGVPPGVGLVVVKRGAAPALLARPGETAMPIAPPVLDPGEVADTTGAGDAFAAGFLGGLLDGADPVEAVTAGHALAIGVLRRPGADLAVEVP